MRNYRIHQLLLSIAILFPYLSAYAGDEKSEDPVFTCSELKSQTLQDLVKASKATYEGNQDILFLVITPDNNVSTINDAIVFFNGTSGIMTDWPADMLTSTKSGKSLCDSSFLVFFDYPGVGGTSQVSDDEFTLDNFAEDVDGLVTYINGEYIKDKYDTEITKVHPLGWSLGSLAAVKFAGLAEANGYGKGDKRQIGNIFLIATKPGGDVTSGEKSNAAPAIGNQASCVTTIFTKLKDNTHYTFFAKKYMVGLMFPYIYSDNNEPQSPYTGANNKICYAKTISLSSKIELVIKLEDASTSPAKNIKTACDDGDATQYTICKEAWDNYKSNRLAEPYLSNDEGVPHAVFLQERNVVDDWNYSYCSQANSNWQSAKCKSNSSHTSATGNGGMCSTTASASNDPVSTTSTCMSLEHITGTLTIMNGEEDMFIQYVYGKALYDAYSSLGVSSAIHTYTDDDNPSGAGHGVLYTNPSWIRDIILDSM